MKRHCYTELNRVELENALGESKLPNTYNSIINILEKAYIDGKGITKEHGNYYVSRVPKKTNMGREVIISINKMFPTQEGNPIISYRPVSVDYQSRLKVFINTSETKKWDKELLDKLKEDRPGYSDIYQSYSDNEPIRNKDLEEKLIQFLGQYGIKAEVVTNLTDNRGVPVRGVANLVKKTIQFSQVGITGNTVSEEVSHFIIDMLPSDSPLRKKLLELAEKSEKFKEVNSNVFYIESYNDDRDLLIKETAGKLLSDAIHDTFENESSTLIKKLKDLLSLIKNYLKSIFGKADPSNIDAMIKNVYGDLAKSVLDRTVELDVDNLLQNTIKEESLYQGLDDKKKKFLSDAKDKITKKLAIYKAKAGKAYKEELQELLDNISKGEYDLVKLEFINRAVKDIQSADKRFREHVKGEKLDLKTMKQLTEYVSAYDGLLEEFRAILKEEEDKDSLKVLDSIITDKNEIKRKYLEIGKELLADFLMRYNSDKQLTQDQLKSMLEQADDISIMRTWLDSIGDSPDQVLSLVSKSVRDQKEKARLETLEISKKLFDIIQIYESKTGKSSSNPDSFYEPFLERTSEGKLTGYFVRKYTPEFYEKLYKYRDELEEFGLGEVELRNRIIRFYKDHQEMKSSKYEDLQNNSTNLNFFEALIGIYDEAINKLPEHYRPMDGGFRKLMPQVRKDFINRLYSSDNKVKSFKEYIKASIVRNEQDDAQYGMLLTESGEPLNTVPIFYTRRLEDPTEISTDLGASLFKFFNMAANYEAMNEIVDETELALDIVKNRKYTIKKGFSKVIDALTKKEATTASGEGSNAAKMLEEFIKMQVYGQQKADQGSFEIFGFKLDTAKTIDLFGKYISLNGLALNLFSGISNVSYGNVMRIAEAAGGEFYNGKDLLKATKEYDKALLNFSLLGDIGATEKHSKLELWRELFDIQNQSDIEFMSKSFNKNRISHLLQTDSLFFLNTSGEHWLSSITGLAIAQNWKLKSGESINMYDAFEVKGNKITIKPEYKDKITKEEIIRFSQIVKGVNQTLDGIYNTVDKALIQKGVLGRLAIMFRKFIVPGFNRRWSKKYYNQRTENYREGTYRTWGRFINDLRKRRLNIVAIWDQLSDLEKRNIHRANIEFAFIIGLMILINALEDWDDDEDSINLGIVDLKYKEMTYYQINRLYTELFFYTNPIEAIKIMKSPAAAVTTITDLVNLGVDLAQPWNYDEEYKRGRKKGKNKLLSKFNDLVPLYSQIDRLSDIESQIDYFK